MSFSCHLPLCHPLFGFSLHINNKGIFPTTWKGFYFNFLPTSGMKFTKSKCINAIYYCQTIGYSALQYDYLGKFRLFLFLNSIETICSVVEKIVWTPQQAHHFQFRERGEGKDRVHPPPGWVASSSQGMWAFVGSEPCSRVPEEGDLAPPSRSGLTLQMLSTTTYVCLVKLFISLESPRNLALLTLVRACMTLSRMRTLWRSGLDLVPATGWVLTDTSRFNNPGKRLTGCLSLTFLPGFTVSFVFSLFVCFFQHICPTYVGGPWSKMKRAERRIQMSRSIRSPPLTSPSQKCDWVGPESLNAAFVVKTFLRFQSVTLIHL